MADGARSFVNSRNFITAAKWHTYEMENLADKARYYTTEDAKRTVQSCAVETSGVGRTQPGPSIWDDTVAKRLRMR